MHLVSTSWGKHDIVYLIVGLQCILQIWEAYFFWTLGSTIYQINPKLHFVTIFVVVEILDFCYASTATVAYFFENFY